MFEKLAEDIYWATMEKLAVSNLKRIGAAINRIKNSISNKKVIKSFRGEKVLKDEPTLWEIIKPVPAKVEDLGLKNVGSWYDKSMKSVHETGKLYNSPVELTYKNPAQALSHRMSYVEGLNENAGKAGVDSLLKSLGLSSDGKLSDIAKRILIDPMHNMGMGGYLWS